MPDRHDPLLAQVADRYWDAVFRDESLDSDLERFDPGLAATVRRMHALDDPPPANPDFPSRLWEDLMSAHGLAADLRLRPVNAPGRGVPAALPAPRPIPLRPRDGGRFATAAVVVLTLVGSLLLSGDGYRLFRGADDATPAPLVEPPGPSWPQYRGNAARTGEGPGPGLVGDPIVRWQVDLGGAVAAAPVVYGGLVYIGDGDGVVHAMDADTGVERWAFQAEAGVNSGLAAALGLIYFGDDAGVFYAVDAATGTERWRIAEGPVANAGPAVADGVVYLVYEADALVALDAETGAERWRAALSGQPTRAAAVADGVVYVGCRDGSLVAVDAASGAERWRVTFEVGNVATPTVAFGLVLAATVGVDPSRVYALDPATGAGVWAFEAPTGGLVWAPSVGGDLVVVPGDDGVLYALDPASGAVRWRFERDEPITASPASVDGALYLGITDGTFYVVDGASGVRRGLLALDGYIAAGPAVAGGMAYLGTDSGAFYAIIGADDPTAATPIARPPASPAADVGAGVAATGADVDLLWAATGDPADPLSDRSAGVVIDPSGNVWVADTRKSRFAIFAPDGTFLEYWGSAGSGDGQFRFFAEGKESLGDIAFGPDGTIYVADAYNHRVQVFAPDRTFLRVWGGEGSGDGRFLVPADVAVDSRGNVFVGEGIPEQGGGSRVQKFAPDGTFLLTWGAPGSGEEVIFPSGAYPLAVDAADRLLVVDSPLDQVLLFDNDGGYLAALAGPEVFDRPAYVAVDAAGNIYATDSRKPNEVKVLAPDGSLLAVFGGEGDGPGQFLAPWGIAVGPDGTVYVVEDTWERGNRLQAFRVAIE